MKQIHYIYKITFLKGKLTNCYYIGKRTTNITNTILNKIDINNIEGSVLHNPMFDNYTGSGKIPRDYFKKYEKKIGETFNKEILAFSKNYDENMVLEEKFLGDKYLTDEKCVNIIRGGMFNPVLLKEKNPSYKKHLSEDAKKKLSECSKKRIKEKGLPWTGTHKTKEQKEKISQHLKEYYKTHVPPGTDKHPTEESKRKNSEAHKKLMQNPEYKQKVMNGVKHFYETHESPNKGRKLSKEQIEKMRKQFTGKPNYKNRGEGNGMYGKKPANIVSVLQYSLDGELIKEWNCIKDAADSVNGVNSNIVKVCKGERKKAYNYIWKYKEKENEKTN